LAEYDGATGAEFSKYIYAGRMMAKSEGGVLRYFLSDLLSTRAVLSETGSFVGREGHLPFGEATGTSGEQEKHSFTTYERDNEATIDYAMNRQYSFAVGRFMQVDPMTGSPGNPQSLNRYVYVKNDPINSVDTLGLIEQKPGATGCASGFMPTSGQWCIVCTTQIGNQLYQYLTCSGGAQPPPISLPIITLPDPGTRGPAGPVGQQGATTQQLTKALDTLSDKCKKAFGGKSLVADWIKLLAPGVSFIDQASASANTQIQGYPTPMTYKQWWDSYAAPRGAGAAAVGVYDPAGSVQRVLPIVITGAGFANPALYDPGTYWLFGGSPERARAAYLVHEFLHIAFGKGDLQLAKDLKLDELGYDISTDSKASVAITEFLANNCGKKKN
jgi:RHS repeat-associated protein